MNKIGRINVNDEEMDSLTNYLAGREPFINEDEDEDEVYDPSGFFFHWHMRILTDPVLMGHNDKITTKHHGRL